MGNKEFIVFLTYIVKGCSWTVFFPLLVLLIKTLGNIKVSSTWILYNQRNYVMDDLLEVTWVQEDLAEPDIWFLPRPVMCSMSLWGCWA